MTIQPHRILITPGDPAGVGPDVTLQIAQQTWPVELVAVADPHLLLDRAKQLSLPLNIIQTRLDDTPRLHQPGTLKVLPVNVMEKVVAGTPNPANASYVLQTLELATSACLKKLASAIVTGPVNKEVINQSGVTFSGHTEFFAKHSHVAETVMLFVVDQLKVALATTHLPLADVPKAITRDRLQKTLMILSRALQQTFGIKHPRILVSGLNPHAGEGGYLGREEIEVIKPTLSAWSNPQVTLQGPLSADTIFTSKYLAQADAILAMYHDQALPLVKYLSFGHAVNMTLGLPFLRTSVDHGTAFSVAGTGLADPGSLRAALSLAIQLSLLTF